MLKIGLTGGIGSGKSTVARIFEVLGIPVYYADESAKRLMNENEELKKGIIRLFGQEAYSNGILDRTHISSQVFDNKEKLEQLNALVHPATILDAEKWMLQQKTPYIIKEAALIFESGSREQLNFVIGVYAPQSLRIQRVMQRDKITREQVLDRLKNQINEDIKMKLCDFVIVNDEKQLLTPQVIALHEKLLGMVEPEKVIEYPRPHD
jgi:dephospho-CoA kinase